MATPQKNKQGIRLSEGKKGASVGHNLLDLLKEKKNTVMTLTLNVR